MIIPIVYRVQDGDAQSYPGTTCFDGTYIWSVIRTANGSLVKIRASDGAYIGPGGVPGTLADATYDLGVAYLTCVIPDPNGTHIWASFRQYLPNTSRFCRIRISDVTIDFTYTCPNIYLIGNIQFDGTYFWIAGYHLPSPASPNPWYTDLWRFPVNTADAANAHLYGAPFGTTANPIYTLAYDGANLWGINDNTPGIVRRWNIATAAVTFTSADLGGGSNLTSVASSGPIVWVGTGNLSDIVRIRSSDGALLKPDLTTTLIRAEATQRLPLGYGSVGTLFWDSVGQYLWATNSQVQRLSYPGIVDAQFESLDSGTALIMPSQRASDWTLAGMASNSVQNVAQLYIGGEPRLSGGVTLEPPPIDGSDIIAHAADLWGNESPCPPTLEYVNQYKNQPPLSLFGI
jgi:hypothetical protein